MDEEDHEGTIDDMADDFDMAESLQQNMNLDGNEELRNVVQRNFDIYMHV